MIGAKKVIGSPSPKTSTIPVPGSDVTLDFTEAFGGVHYNNRTISLVFLSLQPWSDQMAQDSTVKNALHGQKMNIVFSDDDQYYWRGRINVGDWEYYKGAGKVTVTIDAEPYKYKLTDNTAVWHHDTETTGDIVSFEAASASALSSCSVAIEPVQDLNGYDNPWPGGGGKNKLPPRAVGEATGNGVTFVSRDDGSVVMNGTTTAFTILFISTVTLEAGSYVLSGANGWGTSASPLKRLIALNGETVLGAEYGSGVSFTLAERTAVTVRIDLASGAAVNNAIAYPMIRLASETDATFAPYSNICPISGWTEANVTRTGENVFTARNGTDSSNGTTVVFESVGGVQLITVSGTPSTTTDFDIDTDVVFNLTDYGLSVAGILPVGCSAAYISNLGSGQYKGVKLKVKPSFGGYGKFYLGLFETSKFQRDTIDLDGTRYGGTLDVTTGKLTVMYAEYVLTGSNDEGWLIYSPANYDFTFYITISGKAKKEQSSVCDKFENISNAWAGNGVGKFGVYSDHATLNRWYFRPPNTDVTTVEQWKTWLSTHPLTIVYELATPVEVTLSPAEIVTLIGQNHLWSDAGEISIVNPCVTIANAGGRNAIPQITNTAPATIKWGAYSVALSAGTDQQVPQLVIPNGGLKVDVASAADVTFKLTEASL